MGWRSLQDSGQQDWGEFQAAPSGWRSKQAPEEKKQQAPKYQSFEDAKPALPFMAERVTSNGVAYYGDGLQGLARKTFAAIFDPEKIIGGNLTQEKQALLLQKTQEMEGELAAKGGSWLESFGIKSSEVAQAKAAFAVGEGAGEDIREGVGVAYRATGQALWRAFDVLSLLDRGMRKYLTFAQAVGDVAETTTFPDNKSIVDRFEGTPYENVANLLENLDDAFGFGFGYNVLRVFSTGKLAEVGERAKVLAKGSNMVYTMMWDEAKKEEYIRRMEAGESAGFLSEELQNPWVELAGSILGDPTTYMGIGIPGKLSAGAKQAKLLGLVKMPWAEVGKTPTLGKLLGISVGLSGRAKNAEEFMSKVVPELEDAFNVLADVKPDQAVEALKAAINKTGEVVEKSRNNYGFFALDSRAKADSMKQTVGNMMKAFLGGQKTEDSLRMFENFRNIRSEDKEIATQAFFELKESLGQLPFSEAGLSTLHFVERLQDEVDVVALAKRVEKLEIDELTFANEVLEKTYKVIDDFFPSVDDMETSVRIVKEQGKLADAKHVRNAARYDELPYIVKRSNKIHNSLMRSKTGRGLQSFFANTLMGMSPGYASRNLQSDFTLITHDLGLDVGAEVLAKGAATLVGAPAKTGDKIVAKLIDKQKEMGIVAHGALRGQGKHGLEALEKSLPGIKLGAEVERTSSAIVTTRVIEREIMRQLKNGGVPNLQKWVQGVDKDMEEVVMRLVLDNYGDADKVMDSLLELTKIGEVDLWRNAPLDPKFEDALLNVGILDEVKRIQQTASDPAEFKVMMDKVRDVLKKNADEVRKEAALVGADHPLAEEVATLEMLFGKDNIEDMNAFRARQEIRSQLRTEFGTIVDEIRSHLAGVTGGEINATLDPLFRDLNNRLETGNNSLRTLVDTVQKIYKDKKGNIAEQWVKPLFVDPDGVVHSLATAYENIDPTTLTRKGFESLLWKWTKQNQAENWAKYTETYLQDSTRFLKEAVDGIQGIEWDDIISDFAARDGGKRLSRLESLTTAATQWDDYAAYVDEAEAATRKGRFVTELGAEKAVDAVKSPPAQKPIPPYVPGTRPTKARQLLENFNGGFDQALDDFVKGTIDSWGQKQKISSIPHGQMKQYKQWSQELAKRTKQTRANAVAVADATRNFIMHDYNKTYGDHFASYFLMYHYWPSRTYAKTLERAIDNPRTLAAYAKYRNQMERIKADQPDYYRYGLQVDNLFGMDLKNPLFFNFERTLNPINGLTGVDFNDPRRRVDWFSSAVDDFGKMGFNIGVPLQWAMAARLYAKGEDDAGRRWAGRLIPQTKTLKAMLNLMNVKLPQIEQLPGVEYGEFDPFVNVLSDGIDPYEEGQVGRAMAAMFQDGIVSEEEAYDAMYQRSGEIYDTAVKRAITERGWSQLGGWAFGVGWKSRTSQDLEIDRYNAEFYKLISVRDFISPNDYKDKMLELKEKYPFSDALTLSKKGSDERDAAYAYNVLGRMPPGDAYKVMEAAGAKGELVEKFYNDKGVWDTWDLQSRERFMAAIRDLAVMYEIPDTATSKEWNQVKRLYQDVYSGIEQKYGGDIWDKVDVFYQLLEDDKDAAYEFKAAFPEVQRALTEKQEAIMYTPELFQYYGSFDKLESYWQGWMYQQLEKEFGANTSKLWGEYYGLKVEVEAGNAPKSELVAFRKQYPFLFGDYQKRKKELQEKADAEFKRMASILPDEPQISYREGFQPETDYQESILAASEPSSMPRWSDVSRILANPTLDAAMQAWVFEGKQPKRQALNQIEYAAKTNGITVENLFQLAQIAASRQ